MIVARVRHVTDAIAFTAEGQSPRIADLIEALKRAPPGWRAVWETYERDGEAVEEHVA